MDEYLNNLIVFLELDNHIKDILVETTPMEEYFYNNRYFHILEGQLNNLQKHFQRICVLLKRDDLLPTINTYFKNIKYKLFHCGNDYYQLKDFYTTYISNMREEFINYTGSSIFGYSIDTQGRLTNVLQKAESINELLHAFHSFVLNSDTFYRNIKCNKEADLPFGKLTIAGVENEYANQLFCRLLGNRKLGHTQIIALSATKIIMMVRDLGHSLTIEIDITPTTSFIKYHLPKICNVLQVNELKGVKKVKYDKYFHPEVPFTVGSFMVPSVSLIDEICSFLESVPIDKDMRLYGGMFYKGDLDFIDEEDRKKIN